MIFLFGKLFWESMLEHFLELEGEDKIKYLVLNYHEMRPEIKDALAFYKHINSQKQFAFDLVQLSLYENLGNFQSLIKLDYFRKDLEEIIKSIETIDVLATYTNCMYQVFERRSNRQLPIFRALGLKGDHLIYYARQDGSIVEKLHLAQLINDVKQQDIEKQQIIIQMIAILCPYFLSFNPELFTLMLLPFQNIINMKNVQIDTLKRLAEVLYDWCESAQNLNQDHDWLALLTGIFDQSYNGKGLGIFILLQKLTHQLDSLIEANKEYLLINYFNNKKNTLQIFFGITKYFIISENIKLIREISQIILDKVLKTKSRNDYEILDEVYEKFILVKMIGNIQVFSHAPDVIDLLQFYVVGMSKFKKDIPDKAIELIQQRVGLLLSLKFNQRYPLQAIYSMLQSLFKLYPILTQNDKLVSVFEQVKKKADENQKIQSNYKPWEIELEELVDEKTNFQVMKKENTQHVGLENLHNTCFMNSFLQCLYMNQYFRLYILQLGAELGDVQLKQKSSMITALQKLFMKLTFQKRGYCSPYQLKRQLRQPYSNTNDQQDVSEFGHHFLEDLADILPPEAKLKLNEMFFGSQRSQMRCSKCPADKNVKYGQKESFLGLDLYFKKGNSQSQNPQADLKDMIRTFFDEEIIEFTCDNCKQKSEDNGKTVQLISLPPFLMMTIHRFNFDFNTQQMIKYKDKVPMQFDLDMREVFNREDLKEEDCKYQLYAFINHLGNSANSGHYVSYARYLDKDTEMWANFDDAQIQSIQYNTGEDFDMALIDQETPYILFYQNTSQKQLIFIE
ncbi:hypothetical protein pb186bvf_004699 [Paramecium bursaria]